MHSQAKAKQFEFLELFVLPTLSVWVMESELG